MASKLKSKFRLINFCSACAHSPKGKRAAGTTAQVSRDILLSADPDGILIETFALSTLMPGNKAWSFNASVDASGLVNLCGTLRKLGAKEKSIQVGIIGRDLILKFGGTSPILQILDAKLI